MVGMKSKRCVRAQHAFGAALVRAAHLHRMVHRQCRQLIAPPRSIAGQAGQQHDGRHRFVIESSDNRSMTELIVVRHGETDWNRQHRFQGQIDVPLNAAGRAQADRLARRLADEEFDVIVASDLQRARATAEATAGGRAIEADPLWREQAFGVLEGLDATTIVERHPDLWRHWQRYDADYTLPGGESVRTFYDRVWRGLQRVVRAYAGRVAVFTHGGVLDMLWRASRKLPLHGPRVCEIPNTGINRLRWRDGALEIVEWADASHLEGLPEQPDTTPLGVG
jgi:2,3-bisphosphoglycerate-dependent phosphoglycerate mutase